MRRRRSMFSPMRSPHVLHGEDVAELALGFSAGGFGLPAAGDEFFGLAFDVEAQFGFYVGLGSGPRMRSYLRHMRIFFMRSPGVGGCVALRTLATAWRTLPMFWFRREGDGGPRWSGCNTWLCDCFPRGPIRLRRAFAFEAPERGIERALFDEKGIVALATDEAGDGVAVERAPDEGLEDEDIEGSAEEF